MIVRRDPSIGRMRGPKVPRVRKQKGGNEDEKLFRKSSFMHLFSGGERFVL